MLVSFARTTVTRVRAGSVIDHGTVVADWVNPTLVPIEGCLVDTAPGAVDSAHRTAAKTDLTVLMPPGTDILATDHVRVAGYSRDFVFDGGPQIQPSPTGALAQIVCGLNVWEG